MKKSLAHKGVLLATAMLFASAFALSADAAEVTVWHPTTAAGGAFVDPSYWDVQAKIPFSGTGLTQNNVTLAPSVANSTYNDYSTPVTNVAGGQTNVQTNAQLGNNSSVTVSTQHN